MIFPHVIRIAVGDENRWQWTQAIESYEIVADMMEVSDGTRMRFRFERELWDMCKPDRGVNVFIDDVQVFSGLIDERLRTKKKGTNEIEISARDKAGRMLDESARLIKLRGLGIVDLATKLVSPLLSVTTSNATNRRIVVGPRLKQHSKEPAIDTGKGAKKKVEPGETVWQVLSHFLEEGNLIAWCTADGKQLVLGKPNYQQQPQWRFMVPSAGSPNVAEGNVEEIERKESIADRYSIVVAVGAHPGSTGRVGIAKNGPNADGTGLDFRVRKRLIVKDDGIGSAGDAKKRAEREMQERDGRGKSLVLRVPGHGATFGPEQRPALFAFDTIATVVDEDIDAVEDWYITRVVWSGKKGDGPGAGQRTELGCVPVGTDLRIAQ